MSDPVDDWFKREVVVHEDALTRYIRRYWPNPDDVHELRQETYARVYERARKAIPHIARPFIFKVARHLMAGRPHPSPTRRGDRCGGGCRGLGRDSG